MRLAFWQWAILAVETMLALGVLGALAWMLLLHPAQAAQPERAAHVERAAQVERGAQIERVAQAVTPIPPRPGLTGTPTPMAWPTLLPGPTPRATPTRAAVREKLDQAALEQIGRQVAQLRDIQPRENIPIDLVTRAQMMDRVLRRYAADQATAEREMALYRALGLAGPGSRTEQPSTLQAAASGSAGTYNAQNKRLVVVGELENPGADERGMLAHAYTHALQDQHFDLTQAQKHATTTDARLAWSSVAEGDATMVMALYRYGSPPQGEWNDAIHRVAHRAALADLQAAITATDISTRANEIVYFPYVQGAQFIVKLWLDGKGWAQVNHAYADPPPSTSIVLHPERYLTQPARPVSIPLPDLGSTLGQGWTPTIKLDTLGEFIISVHLDEFLNDQPRAAQAADGWAGDSFCLWQATDDRQAFVWQIAWDTPRDAGEFFEAYTALARRRVGPSLVVEREQAHLRWYSGGAGSGLVQKGPTGERTLIVWGPDKTVVAKLLAANP